MFCKIQISYEMPSDVQANRRVCVGSDSLLHFHASRGQFHFQANAVFMSSELQLISPSNWRDLQQLTARGSSLALPVTSRAISPLSSINLTVNTASINLALSRLTLADLIQTAVHYLPQTPWALPLRNGKWRRGGGGVLVPIWRMHSARVGGSDLKEYEDVNC